MDKLEKIKSNINSIKSTYNLKLIFSFINDGRKLNMIIYNKELQKKFDVDIEVYKKKSGKYKIGEKNGKGREYKLNTKELLFEGEYLNGKKMVKEKNIIMMVNYYLKENI